MEKLLNWILKVFRWIFKFFTLPFHDRKVSNELPTIPKKTYTAKSCKKIKADRPRVYRAEGKYCGRLPEIALFYIGRNIKN